MIHKTTPKLQDQERFFFISDRSYPKTDGLRPHQCYMEIATASITATHPHLKATIPGQPG